MRMSLVVVKVVAIKQICQTYLHQKKSTEAGYLNFESAEKGHDNPKKGGGNTKKGVEASKSFNYLISDTKKAFDHLRHVFTQGFII